MAAHEDTLTEFLLDLSTDPDRADRFATNPKGEATRARLSNEERVAVFSGDASQIRARIAADDNGTGIMTRQAPAKRKRKGNGKGIMKKKKRPAPKKKKGSRKRAAKK
ncbi:MAG: hypothetical protein DMF93_00440 [Acidobacteria bacterium]|nr:MAG: hypothetical protein DMF93_00440 [Acidobacteriota bacterium]